jgi:tryptophan-rich sensory protein
MNKKVRSFIIAIIIPLAVGGLSALLTSGSMDLYETIIQPPLSPPAILFPIVWTILYTLMGISSGIIYNSQNGTEASRNNALAVYALQLFINFIWSIIFFNLRAFLPAFILILVLWVLIIVMIIRFYKIDKTAALLQIPYLLWVTFAAYLTLAIYILNR